MPDREDQRVTIAFRLNGTEVQTEVSASERLLDTVRYRLALTGTKEGCGEGECGACTVWIDGLPANACLVPAWQVRGREVTTVESTAPAEVEALLREGATQCGACTPGVVMTARWIGKHPELLAGFSARELMAGNLCRCTGYDGILAPLEANEND